MTESASYLSEKNRKKGKEIKKRLKECNGLEGSHCGPSGVDLKGLSQAFLAALVNFF